MPQVAELYRKVTQQIITDLEQGVAPWTKPWKTSGGGIMPHNAITQRGYNGINVAILWAERQDKGYATPAWLTYQQAQQAGAQVRKGEKSTQVIFMRKLAVKGEDDVEKQIAMARIFNVFNADQVDGLPQPAPRVPLSEQPRDSAALRLIQATQAHITHGGDRAYYSTTLDHIGLPEPMQFKTYEDYLATALHELVHWSGHPARLNRDLKQRFNTKAYAAEELVAELGAAFLCAHLDVKGQLRHAEYIGNWLQLLKDDDRAVFTAASKASRAADYLRSFSQGTEEAA